MQMAYHRLGPLKRHVLNTNVTIKNWWKLVLSDLGLAFHGFQLCLLFVLGVHVCMCVWESSGAALESCWWLYVAKDGPKPWQIHPCYG